MMQPEERITFIPYVMVEGNVDTKRYGVLVTSRRLVFIIMEKTYFTFTGMMLDRLVHGKQGIDPASVDLNQIASTKPNFGIWDTQLVRFSMKKKFLSYRLDFFYLTQAGKVLRIKSNITTPSEFADEMRQQGKKGKEVDDIYAKSVRDALLKVATPQVAAASEWLI